MIKEIRPYKRLWRQISDQRRSQFVALTVLMLLSSMVEMVSVGVVFPFLAVLASPETVFQHPLLQPVIRYLNLQTANELITPLTVVFSMVVMFASVLRLFLLWSQTRFCHALGADFSSSIFRRTMYQNYSTHLSRNSSEIISGIANKANTVVQFTVLPIITGIGSILTLFAVMFVLFSINPIMATWSIFGFAGIYSAVAIITRRRLVSASRRVDKLHTESIKVLQEGLGGIKDILLDGTQELHAQIFRSVDLPLRRAQATIQIMAASPRFLIEGFGLMLIAILAAVITNREGGLINLIPTLGVLAIGAQRLLPVVQQLYQGITYLRSNTDCLLSTLELLEQQMPEYAGLAEPKPLPFFNSICLENVTYRYPGSDEPTLREIRLNIKRGQRIGIIGPTGSGKSTLLDILTGLLKPESGIFTVDGLTLTVENIRAWQAHVAHVPQTIFLADASIGENIAFGIEPNSIDWGLVKEAAKQASIATTIEAWPSKYQTSIGERGIRISGGQRQRIGIARALYKKADVIVLDEATSALDNETEFGVMSAIENLGRDLTIIIVAHRLTTLKKCDQIIELENGAVKRTGTYGEICLNQSVKTVVF